MHPFERWFDASLAPLFRICTVLSLVTMLVLGALDATLRSPTAPLGIVSFELIGAGVAELLAGWSEAQRRDAILLQGLDYLFLLVYSTALASGALLAGRRAAESAPRLAALARPAAWAFTIAGIADAIENTPMTLMLRSGVPDVTYAWISLTFASVKFLILLVGLPYLIALGVAALRSPRPV